MKFACCKSTTEGTTGSLQCTQCKLNYHVACLFPSDRKKAFSAEFKHSWLCPGCSLNQPRLVKNDNTPIRPGTENVNARRGGSCADSPPPSANYEINPTLLDTVKDIIASEMAMLKSELREAITEAISVELKPVRDELAVIRESMNFINSQYETIVKRVDDLEKNMKSCINIKSELGSIKDHIDSAEVDNDKREQWVRRSNVEIFGIPERKGENLMQILRDVSSKAEFSLDPSQDIDFVTRVAPKNNDSKKIKPIVVRFLARWKKDEFLSSTKKLRLKCTDINISGDSFIHFNDHLTRTNKALLQRAKSICKEKLYKYVWVKNCTINVRRSDTSPVIHISRVSDLNKIK
ncbi:uncharacterized protein LOC123654901 [Melitaea cinxia]|uniref:uncharacterized protein LOC123654901 n=1 Tax=Melitaea cinxia TaxID=113334 RepID=UPI001E272F6B|nr:uncharacterized protein LOC123654901 [Melitaea cinxia]